MAETEQPSTPLENKLVGRRAILLSYDEISEWHQDNDFIQHGYRPESNSAYDCFASWLYLHNETVNINSHLLPAIFFLAAEALVHHFILASYPEASLGDRLIFTFFSWITTLSVATIVILVNPRFQGRRWRTFRVCTFVGTGLSGFAPLAHGTKIFGFTQIAKQSGMAYYVSEGFLPVLGAVFYTTRIPEGLKPGRFDFFGCSHQIFHILVVLATAVHPFGILSAVDYNYNYRKCGLE